MPKNFEVASGLSLEQLEARARAAGQRTLIFFLMFLMFLALFFIVARHDAKDWRLSVFGAYVLVITSAMLASAIYYVDLRLAIFEETPMSPVEDMVMEPWEVDDLVIEAVYDEDEEEE